MIRIARVAESRSTVSDGAAVDAAAAGAASDIMKTIEQMGRTHPPGLTERGDASTRTKRSKRAERRAGPD